ncbi:MAG TPA: adenylate/guanylate cyclase domain-containing protein [Solirubrobacteraceae bacterium]|jgi:class 3 adenylate cyclase
MSVLDDVIAALGRTGWSAVVTDEAWRIVWSSDEIAKIVGDDNADATRGVHMLQTASLPAFAILTRESVAEWVRFHAPFALHDGNTREELEAVVDASCCALVDDAAPAEPPERWTLRLEVGGENDVGIVALGERVRDDAGRLAGNAFVFGSALPASVLWFIGQGDQRMFSRLAELIEPGRRPAAVLFADIAGSTSLSRRMASAAYFDLIRGLTRAADHAILDAGGVIGKHAGDGVSAFFLADQVGSSPGAALAALRAARAIKAAAREHEISMRVAIHWGATLYIGQVATSGRLEVTALGDEVNECARIQDAAHGEALLATKQLIERLVPAEALAEGIDPAHLRYELVSDLPDVPEKAIRDAGSIAVCDVGER